MRRHIKGLLLVLLQQCPPLMPSGPHGCVALQAAGEAAEALQQAAAAAVQPLDVFGGNWLLNLLFVGVMLTFAYCLVVLAPRQ